MTKTRTITGALASCISKIFTTVLATRLSKWCEEAKILPECQAGFRAGRSCEDNFFVLASKINLALCEPRGVLYAAYIDYKKTFGLLQINKGLLQISKI